MRYHVLIVEDDSPLRELYALYLKRGNVSSTTIATAEEALKILPTETFDLIMVDLNLGQGMTGLEFIKIVQDQPEFDNLKVIILTSFPEPLVLNDDIHIDLALNKPVNYANLMRALDEVMGE